MSKANNIASLLNSSGLLDSDDIATSAITAEKLNVGQVGGRRNLIINGAMEVWQRGTSQSVSGSYAADRFWMANATSAARYDTDAPSGFTYSTKMTYNASDMSLGQPIELTVTGKQGQFVAGSVVTLSYYAKVDTGTEDINAAIYFRDTKFSATNQAGFSGATTATWTTTWARYTHSFTIPTINSTNTIAALEIGNIGRTAYITGVQLELGDTATPFEHRSYGEELALCYRYYQTYPSSSATTVMFTGIGLNSTSVRALAKPFGGLMRAIPAITLPTSTFIKGNGSSLAVTSVQTGFQVGAGYTFVFDAASGVSTNHVYYITGNTGSDALELTAEL